VPRSGTDEAAQDEQHEDDHERREVDGTADRRDESPEGQEDRIGQPAQEAEDAVRRTTGLDREPAEDDDQEDDDGVQQHQRAEQLADRAGDPEQTPHRGQAL